MSVWVELWVRLKVVDLVAQTAWLTLTEKLDFAGRIHGLLRYSYWGFTAGGSIGTILDEIDRAVRIDSAFTNQNKHRYRLMIVENTVGRGIPFDTGEIPSPTAEARGGPSSVEMRGGPPPAETRGGPSSVEIRGGPSSVEMRGGPPPVSCRGDLPLERDYALHVDAGGAVPDGLFALDCLVRERDGDREAGFSDRLNGRVHGVGVSGMKAGEVWRIIISAESEAEALKTAGCIAVTFSRREGLLLNPHYQRLELISAASLRPGKE